MARWRSRLLTTGTMRDAFVQQLRTEPELTTDGWYGAWLVRQLGRPMERALIRARQRYHAADPEHRRRSAQRRAYARRNH